MIRKITLLVLLACLYHSCTPKPNTATEKIRVIFDTDANNELDDQHAMAYLFFNGVTFDLAGVTVNATRSGKEIEHHMAEAERVMHLCGFKNNLPLHQGADADFLTIQHQLDSSTFDGQAAVDFLIAESHRATNQKTTVIAVGKLTNIALAIQKDPSVCDHLKIVWLGSNYPEPGEYNLENDTASVNYVFQSPIELEVVTVRYGKNSGSAFVSVTQEEVNKRMPGIGPKIESPVTGRHGGSFTTFGDYSVNLFEHIDYHGTPPARSLFDMVAVAIVKNPTWGQKMVVNGPKMRNGEWIADSQSQRTVTVWENFDKAKILDDYYHTLEQYQLVDAVDAKHP